MQFFCTPPPLIGLDVTPQVQSVLLPAMTATPAAETVPAEKVHSGTASVVLSQDLVSLGLGNHPIRDSLGYG